MVFGLRFLVFRVSALTANPPTAVGGCFIPNLHCRGFVTPNPTDPIGKLSAWAGPKPGPCTSVELQPGEIAQRRVAPPSNALNPTVFAATRSLAALRQSPAIF